jgi:hypothetical protein
MNNSKEVLVLIHLGLTAVAAGLPTAAAALPVP